MYVEKAVSEGNIYRAYRYYTEAASLIEGCNPKPSFFSAMEIKLQKSKNEFEKQYNGFMFSYKKSIKLKEYVEAKKNLEAILQLIPDKKDQRNKEASQLLKKINKFLGDRRR